MSTIPDIIAKHVTQDMGHRAERVADMAGFKRGDNFHYAFVQGYLAGQVLQRFDEHPLPSTEKDRQEIERLLKP